MGGPGARRARRGVAIARPKNVCRSLQVCLIILISGEFFSSHSNWHMPVEGRIYRNDKSQLTAYLPNYLRAAACSFAPPDPVTGRGNGQAGSSSRSSSSRGGGGGGGLPGTPAARAGAGSGAGAGLHDGSSGVQHDVYLFGGTDGVDNFGDLWVFRCRREGHDQVGGGPMRWERTVAAGSPPAPRYGHKVCLCPGSGPYEYYKY